MPSERKEHPGQRVRRLLAETGLGVGEAAARLQVSRSQLQRLLGGQSGLSAEMALRLSAVFGIDAREWLDRQVDHDLDRARRMAQQSRKRLKPFDGALRRRNRDHVVSALRRRETELRRDGIDELYLFGSVARGEAGVDSDIDLYFREARDRNMGLIKLGTLANQLSAYLGAPVDLAPLGSLKPEIRDRASKDAVRVF